ncbi:epoxide hydrolase [Actinokineospora auranticolor]|uniref:epoxide hydrolase family protein n=1 Tax=Actinokineospora auranticolor TaxID=155976 RepID=UPI001C679F2B|nr:epoxide hydrolase family protein [Actinokineospora auranticolor]
MQPFTIAVPEAVLADLRDRARRTRWPSPAPGPAWSQGTDLGYLREVVAHWADGFDWRAAESALNAHDHHRLALGDATVHFTLRRAANGRGVPLVLTHGWPSTFVELLPLVPLLTDPAAHGITGPAFDVVIPSLPGYGFSSRPPRAHTTRDTAALWHRLMTALGYDRYAAHGGDLGAAVSTFLAIDHPESVVALHLSNLELDPIADEDTLTVAEREFLEREEEWERREGGYGAIQSTKPQTLGYGLTDSPAALAAWLLEKWRAWSDSQGDPERAVTRDFLLTTLTLFWAGGCVTETLRDYFDNAQSPLTADDRVRCPTAVTLFPSEYTHGSTPPRSWAERLYPIHRWTPMTAGGHFAAVEQPRALATDIAAFFAELDL